MRVVVIGASGTIGKEIVALLSQEHDVVRVGHKTGDVTVDLGSPESIERLFRDVGPFDAVVSAAGQATFRPLADLTDADFELALGNKLMGQVNLVRIGARHINEGGSFTLTSGVLAQEPMPGSASISMANGALEGFTRAAALELQNGQRVNTVSPVFVRETMEMMGMDASHGMPAVQVAHAYKAAVEGAMNGQVLKVRDYAQTA